ncbi:FliH/SctL family protein [Bacteriovoracaceae bacterium]|nr:FliH/SctL family protein [Bacteriovoracaceae bacterium]
MSVSGGGSNDHKVEEYTFQGFEESEIGHREYTFADLSELNPTLNKDTLGITQQSIRTERVAAKGTKFEINPRVKELRGISAQEEADYENKVNIEIKKRLSVIEAEAEEKGIQKGIEAGQQKAYEEAKLTYEGKIEELVVIIDEVRVAREDIYKSEMTDAYKLIQNLTKWVVLKEIDEDDNYLSRLLEKLILELNEKKNLLIKVSADSFNQMDEVIEMVQKRVGELSNVRVEIDHELKDAGIILESEKGIIDASLKSQFENIEKVFETVGLSNDET